MDELISNLLQILFLNYPLQGVWHTISYGRLVKVSGMLPENLGSIPRRNHFLTLFALLLFMTTTVNLVKYLYI